MTLMFKLRENSSAQTSISKHRWHVYFIPTSFHKAQSISKRWDKTPQPALSLSYGATCYLEYLYKFWSIKADWTSTSVQ